MRSAGLSGARCVGQTALFFSEDPADQATARGICGLCPAFKPCKELGRTERHGVWAGEFAPGRKKS